MSDERYMCSIYKSWKKDGMYLYVPKKDLFNRVPKELMELFGRPAHVMDILLSRDKKLALADTRKVMDDIRAKGFYLQMPPPREESLLDVHRRSQKGGARAD